MEATVTYSSDGQLIIDGFNTDVLKPEDKEEATYKRWRAEEKDRYYYIDSKGSFCIDEETYYPRQGE